MERAGNLVTNIRRLCMGQLVYLFKENNNKEISLKEKLDKIRNIMYKINEQMNELKTLGAYNENGRIQENTTGRTRGSESGTQ